jgi:predicted ribosome quality control (RQC) complex YloA/Tae2 family protein
MSEALIGCHVRRVDMPAPGLLALTLVGRELRGVLLIGLAKDARGVGFCERRPIGELTSPLLLRARKCLEGGRLTAAERFGPARVRLQVERAGERFTLQLELRGAHGNALLRDANGEVLAALQPAPDAPAELETEADPEPLADLAALREEGARLLEARGAAAVEHDQRALVQALRAAGRKLERRLVAIERDRARIEQVDELRRRAGLLLSQLHALPRDASGRLELLDESSDPPARVTLEIDPLLGVRRQADAWFQTARKLERGAAHAIERARLTRAELARLNEIAAQAEQAADAPQLAELAARARALGVAVETSAAAPRARAERQQRLPYRQFIGSGGRTILVGRGSEDNDRLTLTHARPHDLWLHARDDAGAHVVVRLERDESCPPELLADAATLAAHFSQARGQTRVDVIHVERRHVRKARKSPPGQVNVAREKVFRLELQPERLRRLLAAERKLPE